MRLILGIGNPGARYSGTRHNIGFRVLDQLSRQHGEVFRKASPLSMTARLPGDAALMKPLTFVNRTGDALAWYMEQNKTDLKDVLVIVDDVNVALGTLRIRQRGSSGGHNGLKDVARVFGSDDWARMRLGVSGVGQAGSLSDHVLGCFETDEKSVVDEMVAAAVSAATAFAGGTDTADLMAMYNGQVAQVESTDGPQEE